jgi:hypothetical protein
MDQQPNTNQLNPNTGQDNAPIEVFSVRTMQKDIERIRQGLEVQSEVMNIQASQDKDAARKFASPASVHVDNELPPKEASTPLPAVGQRATLSAQAMPARDSSLATSVNKTLAVPVFSAKPLSGGTAIQPKPIPAASEQPKPIPQFTRTNVPVREGTPGMNMPRANQPIETLKAQARPTISTVPKGGKVVVENSFDNKGLSLFARLFPTRKKLIFTALIGIVLLSALTYILFAYFGKPLPGTEYIWNANRTAISPIAGNATATPNPTPASTTPEPSVSSQLTATSANASAPLLPVSRMGIATLKSDSTKVTLLGKLSGYSVISQNPGEFTRIIAQREGGETLSTKEFFTFLGINASEELINELSSDMVIFLYGPKDLPQNASSKDKNAQLGLIMAIKGSVESVRTTMKKWESTLAGDFAPLSLDRGWQSGSALFFDTNVYQGTQVRFQNFPSPFVSIDYAIYEGGKTPVLIMTSSRESMYAAISALNFVSD